MAAKGLKKYLVWLISLAVMAVAPSARAQKEKVPRLARVFPSASTPAPAFQGCMFASPVLVESQGERFVVVTPSNGTIAALDPQTGAIVWSLLVPAPAGQTPHLVATPVRVADKLVIAYQTFAATEYKSHWAAVIDLETRQLDPSYPLVELTATKPAVDGSGVVQFNPATALSRAALVHGHTPDTTMGYVYVSFGSPGDIQPWHGWVFELDVDAWKTKGAAGAISAVLVTTPESSCPEEGQSGSQDMICGGGVWTPAGPQLYPTADGFELLVPTGNGQFDLQRRDYANTLMRLGPGLLFDPGCDTQICAEADPQQPDPACATSCKNLFIPRLLPQDPPLRPASGVCDNKSFWECLARLDYDLGANAPVKIDSLDGLSVYVQPGKEGVLYLLDAEQMGVLYDRKQVVEFCGAPGDPCWRTWAGMLMTRPALTTVDTTPVVIVPTFMPDNTHAAGLVALKIVLQEDKPVFQPFWQVPDPTTPEATEHFRYHPSRATVAAFGNDTYVWVVDVGWRSGHGTIYGVRVKDGSVVVRSQMHGRGQPNLQPLLYADMLYVPSCQGDYSTSWLEAYTILAPEDES